MICLHRQVVGWAAGAFSFGGHTHAYADEARVVVHGQPRELHNNTHTDTPNTARQKADPHGYRMAWAERTVVWLLL